LFGEEIGEIKLRPELQIFAEENERNEYI